MLENIRMSEEILYEPDNVASTSLLRVVVEGIKALLTHNPQSMGQGEGAKRGSRIPEPEAEAEAGCYRLEDGTCCLKGEAFRGAILGAAGAWKAAKRATMKSHLAHIVIVEELVPLTYPDGQVIKEYSIDRRRAIVQKQGIIRCRPRFEQWRAPFTIEFDPMLIKNPRMIVDILADGGNRIGVGDYRPQRNGFFGRFRVVSYSLSL
jgi:hypothetical protein